MSYLLALLMNKNHALLFIMMQ